MASSTWSLSARASPGSTCSAIPRIAEHAEHLTVFQRTPNFAVPAWNGPLDSKVERDTKENYAAYRAKARVSFSGDMGTSIAIRTLVLAGGQAYLQAGGGIVTDSEPAAEYEETLHKARGLRMALERNG